MITVVRFKDEHCDSALVRKRKGGKLYFATPDGKIKPATVQNLHFWKMKATQNRWGIAELSAEWDAI